VAVGNCASSPNSPLNKPPGGVQAYAFDSAPADLAQDGLLVSLSFSGGGTRAAAFGYGVLQELEASQVLLRGKPTSLFDQVDILSGVSGGSILAAYMGLRGRAALTDFPERFLYRNAEENLSVNVGVTTIGAALAGGINDSSRFTRWLDDHLFQGATLGDLARKARVFIYASDIYNRNPFVFSKVTFDALCSDFASYPVSHAVAASAAVPIIFSPIILQTFPNDCRTQLPAWVDQHLDSAILTSVAAGLKRYRDPQSMRYVKLMDGGLTDNYGISGFIAEREQQKTPYGPLTQAQAVKLSRALVVVVNAAQIPSAEWGRTLEGPSGLDMINAVSDTAISSSVRASYDAFHKVFNDWRNELIKWRCSLPLARVNQLRGTLAGWNCRDVQFFIDEIEFDDLGKERAKQLSAIDTRFVLPRDQVDLAIAAGRDALRTNEPFRQFLASLRGRTVPARVRPPPVAQADATPQ
jgi:NTE family protein